MSRMQEPLRRLCRDAHPANLLHPRHRQFPPLAPVLHLGLRANSPQRMRLQRPAALLQLATLVRQSTRKPPPRRLSNITRRQRRRSLFQPDLLGSPQQRTGHLQDPQGHWRRLHNLRPLQRLDRQPRTRLHTVTVHASKPQQRLIKPALRPRLQPTLHQARRLILGIQPIHQRRRSNQSTEKPRYKDVLARHPRRRALETRREDPRRAYWRTLHHQWRPRIRFHDEPWRSVLLLPPCAG